MSGVGTELRKMIPKWAVTENDASCGCKKTAEKWDKYGIEWCVRNRELIIDHLMGQSDHLLGILRAIPATVRRAMVAHTVTVAIGRARKVENDLQK